MLVKLVRVVVEEGVRVFVQVVVLVVAEVEVVVEVVAVIEVVVIAVVEELDSLVEGVRFLRSCKSFRRSITCRNSNPFRSISSINSSCRGRTTKLEWKKNS